MPRTSESGSLEAVQSSTRRSRREEEITIEDARVVWPNFSGSEKTYNREGDRNFCILLEDHLAAKMQRDGWNVKFLRAREEGEEPRPYLQVTVKFGDYPPRIIFLTMNGRNAVDQDLAGELDHLEIETWDVTIRPYDWEVNGNKGRKAYLKTMYVKILEDPLDVKYADWDPRRELEGYVEAEIIDDIPIREIEA